MSAAIGTGLAVLGVAWIAMVLAAWLAAHQQWWPRVPACACGKWELDADAGVALPLVEHGMTHDVRVCQPHRELL